MMISVAPIGSCSGQLRILRKHSQRQGQCPHGVPRYIFPDCLLGLGQLLLHHRTVIFAQMGMPKCVISDFEPQPNQFLELVCFKFRLTEKLVRLPDWSISSRSALKFSTDRDQRLSWDSMRWYSNMGTLPSSLARGEASAKQVVETQN